MKTPYEILGVNKNATDPQLKKAFHKLARECHPDSDMGNPWAGDEFKVLSAAYELLSDPKRRALYDGGVISGDGTKRSPRRAARGFTNDAARTPQQRNRSTPIQRAPPNKKRTKVADLNIKGSNVEYCISVDFMKAVRGGVKQISLANGKRLKINIPPRVEENHILRLKGQGLKGIGDGKDGNAYVKILINPDPIFRRDKNNIHIDMPVTLGDAVLGGKIDVPTIDGTVSVSIPKNSNTGTQLRLKGKGLRATKKGDQFVHLKIILPKKPDKVFLEFIKKWSQAHPYKVGRGALNGILNPSANRDQN